MNGSELGLMPAFIQEKDFADGIDKPLTYEVFDSKRKKAEALAADEEDIKELEALEKQLGKGDKGENK